MHDHDPAVWQDLLRAFREGYAEHANTAFILEALSAEEKEALPAAYQTALIARIGTVWLPWTDWIVWGSAAGPAGYPNEDVYARVIERSRIALECFDPLTARAGAFLPSVVRDAFVADPPDARSWWTSLLWWARRPGAEDFNLRKNERRIVAGSPFEDSVRVIEAVGLATDSPQMPYRVRLDGEAIVYEDGEQDGDKDLKASSSNGGSGKPSCQEHGGQPPPSSPPADGPVAPDAFRHNGQRYESLSPTPWRLVRELWEAPCRTCEIIDLREPVWGDHARDPGENEIAAARSGANAFFTKHELPFRVSKCGDFLTLKDIAAVQSS